MAMVFEGVIVPSNPLLETLLLRLRDRSTPLPEFRELVEEVGLFLAYEMSKELPQTQKCVETPLGKACGRHLETNNIVLVVVLRAGLSLAWGMLKVWSNARVGFVAARRVEESMKRIGGKLFFDVEIGYVKLPEIRANNDVVVIVDPMLATGSTLCQVLNIVYRYRPARVVVASLIAAREGVERLRECSEEVDAGVRLYVVAIDEQLNDKGFIVPGLGDAGDRAFG